MFKIVAPVLASTFALFLFVTTAQAADLPDILNVYLGRTNQAAAVAQATSVPVSSIGRVNSVDVESLKTAISTLQAQVDAYKNTPVTYSVAQPLPDSGCAAGSVGVGRLNETLRCDGSRWVAANNLLNDGSRIRVNATFESEENNRKLVSWNNTNYGTAIHGGNTYQNLGGTGVSGSGAFGVVGYADDMPTQDSVGVKGESSQSNGKAVLAKQRSSGYGVYQEGANARNYFQGKVGIGTEDPEESLDLGGGNIKMGYEMVDHVNLNAGSALAVCPANKWVVGGGCVILNGSAYVAGSFPSDSASGINNSWECLFSDRVASVRATAICANIR